MATIKHNFKGNFEFPLYNQHEIKSILNDINADIKEVEEDINHYFLIGDIEKEMNCLEESVVLNCVKYDYEELLQAALN